MGKYDRMDQVQYRNVLSVIIRAKINPSGNARMIKSAAASQEAAEYKFVVPRLTNPLYI